MFGRKNKAAAGAPVPAQEAVVPVSARTVPVSARTAPVSARTAKSGSAGKQAYEARRAEKAGMALDKWMAQKERRAEAERDAERVAAEQARRKAEPGRSGLLRRLIDRAHRPI